MRLVYIQISPGHIGTTLYITICTAINLSVALCRFICHTEGGRLAEGVKEEGVGQGIWAWERLNNRGKEENA